MKKNLLKITLFLKLAVSGIVLSNYLAYANKVPVVQNQLIQQQEEVASRTLWGLNLSPYAREVLEMIDIQLLLI